MGYRGEWSELPGVLRTVLEPTLQGSDIAEPEGWMGGLGHGFALRAEEQRAGRTCRQEQHVQREREHCFQGTGC